MSKPAICAVIADKNNPETLTDVAPLVDLYELRIDMVGEGWEDLVPWLTKPWIACNRLAEEGGHWRGGEKERLQALARAAALGAAIVDIELRTASLAAIVPRIKQLAKCMISYHDFKGTPPLGELKDMVRRQAAAGADICKVVTTATRFEDNLTVLRLLAESSGVKIVSFAMGALGKMSRVFCPLAGGEFTYASIARGKESAPGQMTVTELIETYEKVNQ